LLAYAGLALAACPPAALAQDAPDIPDEPGRLESKTPDIENGNKLARTLCTTCHLIGEPTEHPVPADVPSFASIANRPGQTLDHLSNWLTEPHPPMPNLNLTRTEIRDLAGYIFSLRNEE
jgi:mono/diheme cytochrome c family protein